MYIDDGNGKFLGESASSINYTTGEISFPSQLTLHEPQPLWTLANVVLGLGNVQKRYFFAGWGSPATIPAYLPADCVATVEYLYGDALASQTENFTADEILVDLPADISETSIPGSLRLDFLGKTILDQNGVMVADVDPSSGNGSIVGVFDNTLSKARLTSWQAGTSNTPGLLALRTGKGRDLTDAWTGRAPANPVQSLSFTIKAVRPDGIHVQATADASGIISAAGILGSLTYQTGIYDVRFGQYVDDVSNRGQPWYSAENVVGSQVWQPLPVFSETITIDCVSVTRTALAQAVTGLDPARMPPDGKLPKFRKGDNVAVHNTQTITVPVPVAGQALNLGRTVLDWVWVRDANGKLVDRGQFACTEQNLADGVMTWAATLDTTTWPAPWTVYHRIWFMDVIDDVDQWGRIVLANKAIDRTYPAGSHVSALLVAGDMQAKTSVPFFQQVWQNVFSDTVIGQTAEWAYDYLNYPIQVTNRGCTIKARVALVILTVSPSDVTFKCVVEGFGVLATGVSIHADFAPVNPATNVPFFTIIGNHDGHTPWGASHVVGSAMEFALSPSTYPVKMIKSLMPSTPTGLADEFEFEFRGNINRP